MLEFVDLVNEEVQVESRGLLQGKYEKIGKSYEGKKDKQKDSGKSLLSLASG